MLRGVSQMCEREGAEGARGDAPLPGKQVGERVAEVVREPVLRVRLRDVHERVRERGRRAPNRRQNRGVSTAGAQTKQKRTWGSRRAYHGIAR